MLKFVKNYILWRDNRKDLVWKIQNIYLVCFLELKKKKKKQQKKKTKIEATTTDINEQIVKTKKELKRRDDIIITSDDKGVAISYPKRSKIY